MGRHTVLVALCVILGCVGVAWGLRPTLDVSTIAYEEPDVLMTLAQESPEAAFTVFTQVNDKSYKDDKTSEEYQQRLGIFQSNVEKVRTHNAGKSSYKMALNQFADLTEEEFKARFLGVNPTNRGTFRARETATSFTYAAAVGKDLPADMDWRKAGAVTPVKNQQACGSCWAFSTTGSIEGVNFLKTGQLTSLSEQELVDCDREHDLGCGGGLMDYAFEFVIKNGGLDTEADYAYWSGAGTGLWCNKQRENRTVVSIDSYEDVPENDEKALQAAVANQPVSVAVCASPLMFYASGVLDTCCTDLDHGVLAVGYGVEAGTPYWLVKNSWGPAWGEAGYFKLKAFVEDPQGTCGIAMAASYPVKTHPNHPTIDVCGWLGWSECPVGNKCRCNAALLSAFEYYTCYSWGCDSTEA